MKNEQKYKTPSKHDTIADILAYMRKCADGTEKHGLYDLRDYGTDYLRALADNIEAAMKRERESGADAAQICGEIGEMIGREATSEKYSQVGNAAKMREALANIVLTTIKAGKSISCDVACGIISSTAKAALSAPPRNCDVGTVAEQNERFDKYCYDHRSHEICCGKCPIFGEPCCELAWSQMPYEEGDAK